MRLNTRAGGIVGIVLSAACLGFTYYMVQTQGRYSPALCMLGVAVLPLSLASAVLPPHLLFVPQEVDGRLEYVTQKPKFTTLGGVLFMFGFLAAVGVYVYLETGF